MSESVFKIPIEAKGGDTVDVLIYQQIGNSFWEEGLTAKTFAEDLKPHKSAKTINVRINSNGGSVFEGTAIHNTLRNHGAKIVIHIEGAALSIASIIAMAGDEIRMAANGYLMIHDPMSAARGRSDEMRRTADMLDKVKATLVATYAARTKLPAEEIASMMAAETWLTAQEAKDKGFCDTITGESKVIAAFDPAAFLNVPANLVTSLSTPEASMPDNQKPEAPAPVLATLTTLKSEFPTSTADWREEQLIAGVTIEKAALNFIKLQGEQLTAANKAKDEAEKARVEAEKKLQPGNKKPGQAPLKSTAPAPIADYEGDAVVDFNEKLAAAMKAGRSQMDAVVAVATKHPELHQAYLAATNPGRKQQRLLAEKFEE